MNNETRECQNKIHIYLLLVLLSVSSVSAVSFNQANIEAFYPLNSVYQATDYYGNFHCVNNGGTFGVDGVDLENSQNDYLNCTANVLSDSGDKTFSISAMFYIETGCNCAMAIASKDYRISPTRHMFNLEPFQDGNNNLFFYVWDDSAGSYTGKQKGSKPTEGTWHHIAATYAESTQATTLYLDGDITAVSFNSGTMSGIDDQGAELLIGAMIQTTGLDRFFDGKIANLSLFTNYVLSSAEINETMDVNNWIPGLLNTPPAFEDFNISNTVPVSDADTLDVQFEVSDASNDTLQFNVTWYTSTDNVTWTMHGTDNETWANQGNATYNGNTYHTSSTGDIEPSDTSTGQLWKAEGWLTDGTTLIKVNTSAVNISTASNATESQGDDAIEDGMLEANGNFSIYAETKIIIANETMQSLGSYDRIAVDDSQVFAANYVTENESAQNQLDMGDFVFFFEITQGRTASNITTEITNWITNLLS